MGYVVMNAEIGVDINTLPYVTLPKGTTRIYFGDLAPKPDTRIHTGEIKKTCRHYGGEEDCGPACMLIWGDSYLTLHGTSVMSFPRHNAHRPIKQRSEDFCYGRHCTGQSKG